jgi:hypothetical protein
MRIEFIQNAPNGELSKLTQQVIAHKLAALDTDPIADAYVNLEDLYANQRLKNKVHGYLRYNAAKCK